MDEFIKNNNKRLDRDMKHLNSNMKMMSIGTALFLVMVIGFTAYNHFATYDEKQLAKEAFVDWRDNSGSCAELSAWLIENIHMNSKSEGGLMPSYDHSWNKWQQVNSVLELRTESGMC